MSVGSAAQTKKYLEHDEAIRSTEVGSPTLCFSVMSGKRVELWRVGRSGVMYEVLSFLPRPGLKRITTVEQHRAE